MGLRFFRDIVRFMHSILCCVIYHSREYTPKNHTDRLCSLATHPHYKQQSFIAKIQEMFSNFWTSWSISKFPYLWSSWCRKKSKSMRSHMEGFLQIFHHVLLTSCAHSTIASSSNLFRIFAVMVGIVEAPPSEQEVWIGSPERWIRILFLF